MTPEPLRHNLWRLDNGWRYGPWHIMPANWTRPHPSVDWDWWHDDYDGAPDSGDNRCGSAADRDACIAEIHEWEDDHA